MPTTTSASEYNSEMWFVMAQFLYTSNKFEKAVYFAQKALFINPRNFEALILKARLYIELKKQKEALTILKMVQDTAPYLFEAHKIAVMSYLMGYRYREAQIFANIAMAKMGKNPRTLTLLAKTYASDGCLITKIEPLLQQALERDENYVSAALLLAEVYQTDGQTIAAISLLRNFSDKTPDCTVFAMLGNLLRFINDQEQALEFYTRALK